MSNHKLVVRLKGGLGNQMFQYAAARSISQKNGMELVVDKNSGFVRDRIYGRSYSLSNFDISGRSAKTIEQIPFWLEQLISKYRNNNHHSIKKRIWGQYIYDNNKKFYPEFVAHNFDANLWMEGYFQSELYFEEIKDTIAGEFRLLSPIEDKFRTAAQELDHRNAVAIGIRLYEEAPVGAHYITPFSFYEYAAEILSQEIDSPVFYLFCTIKGPIENKLNLPGRIRYITHDDGFTGELNCLWLLSQFRNHIISNSSFYWWGAWLSEHTTGNAKVIAAETFSNNNTIPDRWKRVSINKNS